MRPSANGVPFALSLVFGLGCLGLIAWLLPNDSTVKAQTEKTRLAGKNFSEAQKAASGLIPDQATTELAVDDGTFEAAAGVSGGGTVTGLNRLTPTNYPATITGISLFFQSQQGLPPASPITILVGTNPSGGANINNVTFQQISAAVETAGSYFFYSVPPVTINSGDFVVGFRATHSTGVLPLAIDRTPPMNRRSYVSTGGPTYTLLDDAIPPLAGNLMIRARVQGQPPGCPSISSINPPGGVVGSQVTITGNSFTGVTAVRFFNNVAAQFTVNSNTQITATVPQGAATGPITISKTNCPNVQTGAFAVNTSSPTELGVDDGSFESGFGLSGGGTSWRVNRLTPNSYPATLNAVSIFFRSASNLTPGSPLTIVYGANLSGGTNISGLQLQTMDSNVQALAAFNVYNVTPLTINSGDFVVGYKITHDASVFPFALDTTPPSQRRSYRSLDGTVYQIIDDIAGSTPGNYGIRARLQGATQNCPTVSGINPTTGSVGSQVTITGTNFTGVNAVRFSNNVNAVFTVSSDAQITATVPAGAVTGPVTISKPNCPDATTAFFTVTGGCTYSINPTSQSFSAGGGNGSVAVTTQAGCAWMAVSNVTWITITSGANGTGSGSVVYSVAANTGAARNETMTIAGQTFAVQQSGCHNASGINPASGVAGNLVTITGSGFTGASAVRFTGGINANFTINSDAQIIATVPGGAVTGPITISKPNCPDVTTAAFTVNRVCTFAIAPASQFFLSSGGTGSVNVTAETGCAWTAMSNAAWITITGGANGSGNGRVDYSVAADPSGGVRSGTMTIAGHTFTVQQGLAAGGGWSRQTSGVTTELRSVHLVSSSEGWAAGANATLLRTTDGGANWSSVNTGADPARGFHTVRFFNSSTGWAGGAGTIARTANGGANWAKANLPATVLVADNAVHNSFIFSSPTSTFFQSGGQGSVFGDPGSFLYGYTLDANGNLSASGGSVWTPTSPIFDLFSLQDSGGSFTFMVGGSGSIRLLDSSPLGYSSQPSGTNQQLNAIQMMRAGSDLIGWVAGNGGTILKTTNGGSAWTLQSSGTTANLRDVHFVDANRGWAVGDGGVILTTANGGSTWTPEPSGVTTDLRGVFFASAEAGFVVGSNGVILKRTPQPGAVASVSAASFIGTGFAPESIVAAFGQGLAGSIEIGNTVPLPTTLAGTSVVVRDSAGFDSLANPAATDRLAPLFFVSPGQINLQIPPGTPPGVATINVLRGGAVVASGVVQISSVAPGLFAANASGQGVAAAVVFRRRADGSESFEPVAQFDQAQNRLVPLPIDLGPESDQVFLILYGTGFRFNSGLQAMTVSIGGVNSEVFFASAAPGFVGLDQANVRLSRSLIGRGEVDVVMIVDGMQANVVKVAIK